jgi:hypothetical protein
MSTTDNPGWWKNDYDSSWDRVKDAFRRDWEQTKHDFGSSEARDLDQNVDDTVRQMVGSENTAQPTVASDDRATEDLEPAWRYGYGARQHYGTAEWNDDLDARLRNDWTGMGRADYDRYRDDIRRGWDYGGVSEGIGVRGLDAENRI